MLDKRDSNKQSIVRRKASVSGDQKILDIRSPQGGSHSPSKTMFSETGEVDEKANLAKISAVQ